MPAVVTDDGGSPDIDWRPVVRRVFPATESARRFSRQVIAAWLERAWVPRAVREDLTRAVDAAVTNAVEHAYRRAEEPGQVVLELRHGRDTGGQLWVGAVVSDRGTWRAVRVDGGYRGGGLHTITTCTDRRDLATGTDGTTVTMSSRLH